MIRILNARTRWFVLVLPLQRVQLYIHVALAFNKPFKWNTHFSASSMYRSYASNAASTYNNNICFVEQQQQQKRVSAPSTPAFCAQYVSHEQIFRIWLTLHHFFFSISSFRVRKYVHIRSWTDWIHRFFKPFDCWKNSSIFFFLQYVRSMDVEKIRQVR